MRIEKLPPPQKQSIGLRVLGFFDEDGVVNYRPGPFYPQSRDQSVPRVENTQVAEHNKRQ